MPTRTLFALFAAMFLICGCEQPNSVASVPSTESDSSEKFYAAMERGDYETGVSILQEEVAKPNPPGEVMYNLGLAYEKGAGVKQDFEAAAQWYQKAAEQGDPDAQYNLAVLYENGTGVATSLDDARKWYLAAAAQGYRNAQYNLGLLYSSGSGVTKSNELAYMWWDLAASEDGVAKGPAERNKQRIASTMSKRAIDTAEALAERCKSSNYQACDQL